MKTLGFRRRNHPRSSPHHLCADVRRALQGPALCLGTSLVATALAGGLEGARAAEAFPAVIELRGLQRAFGGDGSVGFVLNGIAADDYSGRVGNAGDVNGDGIEDLLIGATADVNGHVDAGESYVVFGRTTGFPAAFELRLLQPALGGDGSEGFILQGRVEFDHAGFSVSGAGDVNGDGIDDLLIGAYSAGPGPHSPGESYVVFGRRSGFPAAFKLGRLHPSLGGDGSEGFVLQGIEHPDFSGRSVSGAGDVNGDGLDDVIIGSSNANDDAGESYVVFGRSTGYPALFPLAGLLPEFGGDGSEGFILQGIEGFDFAGYSVSGAGDVNGDGLDDLLIGAKGADPDGRFGAGETYVVFGRTTGFPALFELRRLDPAQGGDGSEGIILRGIQEGDESAFSVSGAGDVNSDGIDDLIIGALLAAPNGQSFAGESYVVFGRATGFPAVFELARLRPVLGGDGSQGFVLEGSDADDHAGRVSGTGDVNSDGIDDVLIGAASADPGGRSNAGASYVVFGRASEAR